MLCFRIYYRLDKDAFYEWYRIVTEAVDIAVMMYDLSWRSELGTGITLSVKEPLFHLPRVISLKYGSPN